MVYLKLFWSFAKIGLFGFGGGPSMIPLIQEEVVEIQGWLSREEFLDAYALGSSLPGPIATKMASYVGHHVGGVLGAMVSLIAITVPTAVLIIILLGIYLKVRDNPYAERFLRGVRPVVIALLAVVIWEFLPRAFGSTNEWIGNWELWLIALLAFGVSIVFNIHPAILIVIGGAIGVAIIR